ncbi:PTAC2 [Symbiodinium sp. KB8]|nr:PTAC2 [Symbiodinium sp. KB8]
MGCALASCRRYKLPQVGPQFLTAPAQFREGCNGHSQSAVLSACDRGGRWEVALDLLSQFQAERLEVGLVVYNAAIAGCKRAGQWQLALSELEPNTITKTSTISACALGIQWARALELIESNLISCNAAAGACGKERSFERDAASYSIACGALGEASQWPQVFNLQPKMLFQTPGLRGKFSLHVSRSESTGVSHVHTALRCCYSAMRLNALLGLGGLAGRKSEKPPEAKRHKRLDVLESLGIDQNARGHPATSSSSSKKAVQSLSGSSSDKEELRKWLAGGDVGTSAEPDVAAPLPAAAENAADEAEADAGVDSATPSAGTEPVNSPRPVINWREAFSKAQDRWDVVEGGARCYYHHSDKGLFFEWDQQTGVLFQYFFGTDEARSVPVGDDDLPERGAIWSSECPDTHAEVWEVLPLPPTDPRAKADLDMPSMASAGQTSESASEMPPPHTKKRKKTLPPVPVMSAAPGGPAVPADDDDDDDLRLPDEAEQTGPVLGCEGPPAPAPTASPIRAEVDEDEEEEEGAQVGSFVLDEDEEAADLASEDCALPAAPADKAEPSAADLDLDMFAGM